MLFTPFSTNYTSVPRIYYQEIMDAAIMAQLPSSVYSNPMSLSEWNELNVEQKTLLLQYYIFLRNSYFDKPANPSTAQGTVGPGIKNLIFTEDNWNGLAETLRRLQNLIVDTVEYTSLNQPMAGAKTNLHGLLNSFISNYNNLNKGLNTAYQSKLQSMLNVYKTNTTESGAPALKPITLEKTHSEISTLLSRRGTERQNGGRFVQIKSNLNNLPKNGDHLLVCQLGD